MYELQEIADCLNRKLDSKIVEQNLWDHVDLIQKYVANINLSLKLIYDRIWLFELEENKTFRYRTYYTDRYKDNEAILCFVANDNCYDEKMRINHKIRAYNYNNGCGYAYIIHPSEASFIKEELEFIKNYSKEPIPLDVILSMFTKVNFSILPIDYLFISENLKPFNI